MEINKIINGECIEILKTIPSESIDLIFADPPYWLRTSGVLLRVEGTEFKGVNEQWDQFESNENYIKFTRNWLSECKRVLKKDGSIWVIGGMQCIYTIGAIMQDLGFWFINDVIWQKSNPTPNFRGTRLTNSHETLIWATKNEKSRYTFNYKTAKELNIDVINYHNGSRKQLGSIWKFPVVNGKERIKDKEGNKLHSTQKPEEMLYRIINISSKLNDIVLDPFGGTMTTAKVAKQCGRNYITIEKEEKYCEYGRIRVANTKIQIGDIEKSIFDVKPIKVTLKQMIEDGFLIVGEKFYLKNKNHVDIFLTTDGKLITSDEQIYDIHVAAAKLSNSKSVKLNGFDYWCVKRDGNFVELKIIREEYRKHILKK